MKIENTLDNQDMTKQQEEKIEREIEYLLTEYKLLGDTSRIANVLEVIQSEIDLAVAEERKRIVEIIEGFEVYDDEADNCRRFISNTISLITKEN
jgi:hypothetical protein